MALPSSLRVSMVVLRRCAPHRPFLSGPTVGHRTALAAAFANSRFNVSRPHIIAPSAVASVPPVQLRWTSANTTATGTPLTVSPPVAPATASPPSASESAAPAKTNDSVSTKSPVKTDDPIGVKSPTRGSYIWAAERALSIATTGLVGTAFVVGSEPLVDFALGFVLPMHVHLGFDTIIHDYIPHRHSPRLHRLAVWTLRAATGLVIIGCYDFNTNDVGMTAFVKRMWTGHL
ncbi:membrane anchor subunit of succinate dehydrogenase, Sdh4 [Cladochytrium tenue]|nr:membrane anchor subunit of succinate dehydrogenase, Sdh4 [Cladochytrium tenue]